MHSPWSGRDRNVPADTSTPSRDERHSWARRRRTPEAGARPSHAHSFAPSAPAPAIILVTDREAWADGVIDRCCGASLVPERWLWAAVADLEEPGLALVADVASVGHDLIATFETWARRAWQPLCIIALEAVPAAGRLAAHLRDRAFDRIVPTRGAPARTLQSAVQDVLACDAWIAVLAARTLGCDQPVVIRSLSAGLELLPTHHTVRRWARALGYSRRQDLESVFAEHSLPSPKTVLDRLRLARLVHAAATSIPTPSRDQLAERFGYSSGDYLGKRAKALTGSPLGRLVREGVAAVFRDDSARPRGRYPRVGAKSP